jgi:hypothetical protein
VCLSHTTSLAGWHHCILLPSTASYTCLKLHVMLSFVAVLGFNWGLLCDHPYRTSPVAWLYYVVRTIPSLHTGLLSLLQKHRLLWLCHVFRGVSHRRLCRFVLT